MDEMAFMSNAGAIDRSMKSATSCMIYTSTPNGEGGEYYNKRNMAYGVKD